MEGHGAAAPPEAGERALRAGYDLAVLLFAAFAAVLVAIAPQDRGMVACRIVVALLPPLLGFLLERILRRRPRSRLFWTLLYAIPLLFFVYYFRLTGQIWPFFPRGQFDGTIMGLDGLLFGDPEISMRFQETPPFSSPAFGELMCFSYAAYFLFMPVFGAIIIISQIWRNPGPARICAWYVLCVAFTYYAHYTIFFLFPVEGPAFHLDGGIKPDPGFAVNQFLHAIVSRGDVPAGCFPSSHVAIALLHAFIAVRLRWRWLAAACFAITFGICFAIVYTRAHYAVDAPAGLISGTLCWIVLGRIEARLAGPAPAGEPQREGGAA